MNKQSKKENQRYCPKLKQSKPFIKGIYINVEDQTISEVSVEDV